MVTGWSGRDGGPRVRRRTSAIFGPWLVLAFGLAASPPHGLAAMNPGWSPATRSLNERAVPLAGWRSGAHVGLAQEIPPEATPIVDPEPTESAPGPSLALPLVANYLDPLAPGPVLSQAQGYVAPLERLGRDACAPATHVLLDRPLGELAPRAIAVLYRDSSDPNTNLDFHIGLSVTVTGVETLAPPACRAITSRSIGVRRVEPLELPPGGLAGRT